MKTKGNGAGRRGRTAHPSEVELARARELGDERIKQIMRSMCDGSWRAGESHMQMAEEHGVALQTVNGWATNASRTLRLLLAPDDKAEVLGELLAGIEQCKRIALEKDDPDVKAALTGIELRGKFLGMFTTKLEVKPPREQLWESVREWLADPSPELVAALNEAGWTRRKESRDA